MPEPAIQPPFDSEGNWSDYTAWRDEPLTLDNTSAGLVDALRHLAYEYGLAGVRQTLDLIEASGDY